MVSFDVGGEVVEHGGSIKQENGLISLSCWKNFRRELGPMPRRTSKITLLMIQ